MHETFGGCAFVLAYEFNVSKIYIASSFTLGQFDIGCSDPRTDMALKCAGMSVVHDGYEISRQQKVEYLVSVQKSLGKEIPLRVCSFNTTNCCMCEKCLRTMLEIMAENGKIENFGFHLNEPVDVVMERFLEKDIIDIDEGHLIFWKKVIAILGKNKQTKQEQDLYELLRDYPFEKKKREYLFNYYSKNFFKIVKRKIKERIE